MKKFVCCLLLFICVCAFACAEESAEQMPSDLFDLWDYGGESPVWVATAVPVTDGILIASAAVKDIPAEQLAVTDGKNTWSAVAVLPDENEQLTLVFYDPATVPVSVGAWPLLGWGESVSASSCMIRFGDRLGSRINRGVLASEEITRQ